MTFHRKPIILSAAVFAGLVLLGLALYLAFVADRTADPTKQGWRRAWEGRGVERPNIILVTLDTTRADHLGCYGHAQAGTPVIDSLATAGVLFSQAATPAPLTLPAHASIMTGLYPTYHGVRLNGTTALGQDRTTLAEVLAAQGYRTGAFVAAFVVDGRWGLNQGFGTYDDRFDLGKFKRLDLAAVQRPANEVVDAALQWLDGNKEGPFFAWVHLYDPHSPYEPPEPFRTQYGGQGPARLYDGEIAFADQQVGRLVSWLGEAGLSGRTIVVVAGDHGEGLGSHGEGTHGFFLYDYAVHVPLIVATPFDELRGVRVDDQVSLVDVFPTVLDLAGIDRAAPVHGRSLVASMLRREPQQEVAAYSESMTPGLQFGWSALRSMRSGRYKFIEAPRPELYDLQADPGEARNIVADRPAIAAGMGRELARLTEETGRDAPAPEAANLDRETMERLAALGYVGTPGSPSVPAGPESGRADPKDKLAAFSAVQEAGALISDGEHAQAARLLEEAIRGEPEMPQALLMLGSCYTELGRRKEARARFDQVLRNDPQSVQGLIGMANILLEDGQSDDVVTLCRKTLSIDPRNTQAYTLLGDVYIERHEPSTALPFLERAVEIQPKITQGRLNLAACLIEVKQLPRAQAMLQEILAAQPKFPGAQFNLGVLYEELQRPEEAGTAYLAEIANHPNGFKARFNLGKLLAAREDWTGSAAQLREVVRIAPKRPEGYLFLARALLQQSAPPGEILALADQGLARAPTPELKALGWFVKADAFTRMHQPEQVKLALRHAQAQLSLQKDRSARGTVRD
jgi:arylsulfatase A-like enzyme/cytochrome c-type biogenesis protein CcmH/NrfG